jgi:hypothetical protein
MPFLICFTPFYPPTYQSILSNLVKINNLPLRKYSFHQVFPTILKLLTYNKCIDRHLFFPHLLENIDERIQLVKFILEYWLSIFNHCSFHLRKSMLLNNCFLSVSIRLSMIHLSFISFGPLGLDFR